MKNFEKVVLATDFSETSEKALQYAQKLTQQLDIPLEVLHVFDVRILEAPEPSPYKFVPDTTEWMKKYLEDCKTKVLEALHKLCDKAESAKRHFVEGDPAQQITQFSKDNKVDLLIMGTHGYTGIKRMFMGSVAEYVVRHAGCPVITVRN